MANKAKIDSLKGERHDVALFAHVTGHSFEKNPSDIHLHRANTGWCWRIPLREKTSVGIVMSKEHWNAFGKTKEERFDNFLKKDDELKSFLGDSTRITEIQQYSNYQLEAKRFYGKNWVLIGDAAGFIDPIFSSGLYLGMHYATVVADILLTNGDLSKYQKEWKKEVKSWKKMMDIWYNGRLFTTFRVGQEQLETAFGKAVEGHIVKHFTSIFTGEAVRSPYSMWLLSFMTGYLIDFMRIIGMHKHKRKTLSIN